MFRKLTIAAALISLGLGSPLACFAAPLAVSAIAAKTLTTLNETAQPSGAIYDLGSIGSQSPAPLTHTFVLRNDMKTPLTLDHLQSSCPCTTATVGGSSGAGDVVAPGQSLSVSVAVNPQMLSPGLLHKSVWLFVQGQDAPAATLEVTGALLPAVSFSPPSLAFGQIERGSELTLLLRVTPLASHLEQGTELRLVSPDPDVSVTAVPLEASASSADEAAPAVQSLRVRLAPHTHIGRLQGKLFLVLAHVGDPVGGMGPVVDTISWRAEATGDVVAAPTVIAFGVMEGKEVTRRIVLAGTGLGTDPKALVVSSTNPYVTAALKPLPAPNPKLVATKQAGGIPKAAASQKTVSKTTQPKAVEPQMELDVRLDAHAPAGPLDASVTVTTPSGEQFVLPAFAVVRPAVHP